MTVHRVRQGSLQWISRSLFIIFAVTLLVGFIAPTSAFAGDNKYIKVTGDTNGSGNPPAGARFQIWRDRMYSSDILVQDWTLIGNDPDGTTSIELDEDRTYYVVFEPVSGYATPPNSSNVPFDDDDDYEIYIRNGNYIAITYEIAVEGDTNGSGNPPAGALFRITGPSSYDSGWLTLTGGDTDVTVPGAGTYTIEYSLVAGYWKPANGSATLTAGDPTESETGNYLTDGGNGSISVRATKDGANGAPTGGQARIVHDGGLYESSWQNLPTSGTSYYTFSDLDSTTENYTVQFSDVAGYTKPANSAVSLINTTSGRNKSVTGNYVSDNVTVTFASAGNGTVTNSGANSVPVGGSISSTATANTGYHFVNWTKTGGGTSTDNPLSLTNVTETQTWTANFAINQYTVTFNSSGDGTVTNNGANTVNHGSGISSTATANPGYHFVNWTKSGGGTSTDNPLNLTNVTETQTWTAHFSINQYTVTFNSGGNGTVTNNGANTVNHGSGISSTATASVGYHFVNWTGSSTSTNNPLNLTNVTGPLTYTANFARSFGTLNVNIVANGSSGSFSISGPGDFTPVNGRTTNYSQSVPTGVYTVTFATDANYDLGVTASTFVVVVPAATGALAKDASETVTGTYTRKTGTLNVNIVRNGSTGSFSISGPADFTGVSGQTSNYSQVVPTGTYTVTYTNDGNYDLGITATTFTVGATTATGTLNKNATETVTGTYTRKTGTLNVNIVRNGSTGSFSISGPADFTAVSGRTMNYSQVVPTGTYTVTYTSDANFDLGITATTFTVGATTATGALNKNATETVAGIYTRKTGTLNVNIVRNGSTGSFSISGPADFTAVSGQTANYSQVVPTGTYTVTFTTDASYDLGITATTFTVGATTATGTLNKSATETVAGTYTRKTGTLNVNIVRNGSTGSFSISGPADFTAVSGQTANYSQVVPTGTYTVTYTSDANYDLGITATSFTVGATTATGALAKNATETVTGTYTRKTGTLVVDINTNGSTGSFSISGPADFTAVSGRTSSFNQVVPTGAYTVTYTEDVNFTFGATATSFTVASYVVSGTLAKNATESVNGVYTPKPVAIAIDIVPDTALGENPGWSYTGPVNGSGSGESVVSGPPGTYNFTFSNTTNWKTSGGSTKQITLGPNGSGTVTQDYTRKVASFAIEIASDRGALVFGHNPNWTLSGTPNVGDPFTSVNGSGASTTVTDVPFGSYLVTYHDTATGAWITPAAVNVTVGGAPPSVGKKEMVSVADGTVTPNPVVGTYIEKTGSLAVAMASDNTTDGDALSSGAAWNLVGTSANGEAIALSGSGASTPIASIPWGSYTIIFRDIFADLGAPWDKPADIPVAVDGVEGTFTGIYIHHLGAVRVLIDPSEAVTDGAQWRIYGSTGWRNAGAVATGIPTTANLTIEFRTIDDWFTPALIATSIAKNNTTEVTGTYSEIPLPSGDLTISFDDENCCKDGAQWQIILPEAIAPAAEVWHNSGDTIHGLPNGTYEVVYKTIAGWIKPHLKSVTVNPGIANKHTAEYVRPLIVHKSDYDGNGTEDLAVYNAKTRKWSVASAGKPGAAPSATTILEKRYGKAGDIMAPGDYDGDGSADLAYWREETGEWAVRGQFKLKKFGQERDIPVPGDYDGDGRTEPALFRPSTGEWLLYNYATEKVQKVQFGEFGDIPVPGNYDGDAAGRTDLAVWNVETGMWEVAIYDVDKAKWIASKRYSGKHGIDSDIPVQGDYDGDGKTDLAVYERGTSTWKVKGQFELEFGEAGDLPVPNDWAGLGRVIPAVFRTVNGKWLAIDNLLSARYGQGGQPLVSGR